MLPATGHFKDIECPFLEHGCDRPYCHFRHKKRNQPLPPTQPQEQESAPVYNPTPKSQLASTRSSHIPIKYVPDLAVCSERPFRKPIAFPTYKPTPLSVLNKIGDGDGKGADSVGKRSVEYNLRVEKNELFKKYPEFTNTEYNPSEGSSINFEELSNEFDLIDEIIGDDVDEDVGGECKGDDEVKKSVIVKKDVKEKKVDEKTVRKDKKKETSSKSSSPKKEKSNSGHKNKEEKTDRRDKKKDEKHRESSKGKHRSSSSKSKKSKSDESKKSKHEIHKDKNKDTKSDKQRKRSTSSNSPSFSSNSDDEISKLKIKNQPSKSEYESDEKFADETYDDTFLEEDTMQECFRIFNEYKPEEPKIEPKAATTEEATEPVVADFPSYCKKRVAHQTSDKVVKKISHTAPKPKLSAAQVMANRFKLAKDAQANDDLKNVAEEIKREAAKRSSSTTLLAPKQKIMKTNNSAAKPTQENVPKKSLLEEIMNARSKPVRIAPVQNVTSIQRAKERLEQQAKQRAMDTLKKTQGQTVPKGAKRVAHVPDMSLAEIPEVLQSNSSKLPVNVRTRYLTLLAEECVKLYLSRDDAYKRALEEEFKCYERCKVLVTYRNSAMLSINRLRKELQEREKSGLGPIGLGEDTTEQKGSQLKGRRFYENIKQYILSEKDLIEHGYPRESDLPGRAIMKQQKPASSLPLEENERICARCSKLYLVNNEGFPLYPEDCIYHPLKKRTLRGERTYLCCKSTEDVGCATSHTHVCDGPVETELEGFQTTMEPSSDDDPRNYAIYALDCEMCYTTKGLELTRVTIIDVDCKTVYESLVKPINPIIDYNTRFSGITKEQMDKTSTSILQVQANILHLCNSNSILIGHSLESDMKALKIIHSNIIDTAVLFPHKMGLPHKRALRTLASEYLRKIIQNDVCGHDSAEDALTCMELLKWKVKDELKVRGIKL